MTSSEPPGGPGRGPLDDLIAKASRKGRLFQSALGRLPRESAKEKDEKDREVLATARLRAREQQQARDVFEAGWNSGGGIYIEDSARKHLRNYVTADYLPEVAAQLRRLGADTDAGLTGWLEEQFQHDRFKIGWKTASVLDFTVHLEGTGGPHVSGTLEPAPSLGHDAYTIFVRHIGPGAPH
jgi:hypothetical protein